MHGSRLALWSLACVAAAAPCAAGPRVVIEPIVHAPACITLVGSNAGVPAGEFGQFRVVVTNVLNPAGVQVVIDLSGCPDLKICADQLDPNAIVDCPGKTVRKYTDATGTATFTVLGGSVGPAASLAHAGKVYADGHLGATPSVSTFDLDGSAGVGANDFSLWLHDFGTGVAWARSDYDCDGHIGANDMSMWLDVFASGAMANSCAASCP